MNHMISLIWTLKTNKQTNTQLTNEENRLAVARGEGWELRYDVKGGQKIQTSNSKISPGNLMCSVVTIVKNTVLPGQHGLVVEH